MSWTENLSVRLKLALAPAICLVMLGLSAAGALWGFAQQRNALDSVVNRRLPDYEFAVNFESGLRDMNGLINSSLGYEAMGYGAKEIQAIDAQLLKIAAELRASLAQRGSAVSDETESAAVRSLAKAFEKYDKSVKDTMDMKPAGAAMASSFLSSAQKEYQSLLAAMQRISKAKLEDARHDVEGARQAAARAQQAIAAAALVALLSGSLLTLFIARGLLRRILALSSAVSTIAAGNLGSPLASRGRDEVGRLMADVETVRLRLATSIAAVRQSADMVRGAADDIAVGNSDLSQRTELQASSLQQAASSMEELTAAINSNASIAQQVSEMASSASAVAEQGGAVVGKVVVTMNQISDSSRKIVDIIGTIDGIAFQTNILALNAAVEAARAGDQGRGFAVVASEVRGLAQRSAEAAKEIKALINSSVGCVEAGSRLVVDAGQTMREIVAQVKTVSERIEGIRAANSEQTAGASHVCTTVNQLDRVTQQNAALVEEAAAAAEELRQQAASLVDSVSVFHLEPSSAA